jgi:hypothetical protein
MTCDEILHCHALATRPFDLIAGCLRVLEGAYYDTMVNYT